MNNSRHLSTFIWKGLDKQQNNIRGEVEAININFARIALVNQGLTLTKIYKKTAIFSLFPSNRISSNDITNLLRQLALLLNAGIALLNALSILSA